MGSRAQRFGISIGRGWVVLLLLAGGLLLGAYWLGPLRPIPAQLELLAVDGGVAVPQVQAEARRTAEGGVVFAIPVAVRNVGAQSSSPTAVVLSVPPQFRIATPRGRIAPVVTPGVPLHRYPVPLERQELRPDSQATVLPGLDTIFLEPDLPRYYCSVQSDIPEFGAAPRFNAQTLSNMRIFYSFAEGGRAERQTGLLTVALDPSVLDVAPAATPPAFPTILEPPSARAPDTGILLFAGARTAHCGDPEQPVELYTTLWETRQGGRVFVVYVDNIGRKRLYDLNRDGVIELETWDADADGRFEARRQANFATPEFLMPLPPRDLRMTQPDPVRPDSAWLELFHRTDRGPDRFAQSGLVAHPEVAVVDSLAADSLGADSLRIATDVDPDTPVMPSNEVPVDAPAETPQFLALFADTAAGPFRFSSRSRQPPAAARSEPPAGAQRPQPGIVAPGTPTAEEPATGEQPVAEPEPEPEPAPAPPPRRRQPLGTPIDPPR